MSQTAIKIRVNDSVIDATLNDSLSAQDLLEKLPYRVNVSRAAVDYCGVLSGSLKSDASEAQRGWKDGDISYIPGADWIAFFFDGEKESVNDTNPQHIIGKANNNKAFDSWPSGAIEVLIERA